MKSTHALAAAGFVAACFSVAPASAQTLTVVETTTGSPDYTYSYQVTPTAVTFTLSFGFATDSNVTFSATTGPLTLVYPSSNGPSNSFVFAGFLPANTAQTFRFTSPDEPTGTVDLASTGMAAASKNGVVGPAAAPEPSGLMSLGIFGGCLALSVALRRRGARAA